MTKTFRTGLNAGIYDMLHVGHINLLKRMRENCDKVVVVLHDDKSCFLIKGKFPIQSLQRRKWQLKNCGLVDSIVVTRKTDPAKEFDKVIKKHKHVVYMRGDDKLEFPGKWLLDKRGVETKFYPYTKDVSSSRMKKDLLYF
jgi:glycerol-3-phosphate cytidylyltransferase